MGSSRVAQSAYEAPSLLKALDAAGRGNFKVRIAANNGAVPREVAEPLNEVFAATPAPQDSDSVGAQGHGGSSSRASFAWSGWIHAPLRLRLT